MAATWQNPANPRRRATTFLRFLIQIRSRRKKATEHVQHSVLERKAIHRAGSVAITDSCLCASPCRGGSGRGTLCRGGVSAVGGAGRVTGRGDLYSVGPGGG